ncbi:MAG: glycosyltransferase family 39 protein [Bacteroidia bacterium]|nr:glycosyltransferase family 39 protein [Bacteroidia bacterium]
MRTLFIAWVRHPAPWLLAVWLLLNLVQAGLTELFHDEAYYWLFSRRLAVGYFEHPPMIAWLIRLGTVLLPGELGVRLLPALMGSASVALLWRLSGREDPWLFFGLAFSMLLMHLGGFFAAPDTPLACFGVLFLLAWKRYLARDTYADALLAALAAVAMLYSKYHAAMLLGLVLLSWPGVLRRRTLWPALLAALLLCLPLLGWLYEQRLGTFAFHLADRVRRPWGPDFLFSYLGGQLGIAGPLTGLLLYPAALLHRPEDRFGRALKWIALGIPLFLLLLSFRAWIEANWAALAYPSMLILAYGYIRVRPAWRRWALSIAVPGALLLVLLRVQLVSPFLPPQLAFRTETSGWKAWADSLARAAGPDAAVFVNTYQYPSKYQFYSGSPAWTLSNALYHPTQFDLWGAEDSLQGKPATVFMRYYLPGGDSVETPHGRWYFRKIPAFRSYGRVRMGLADGRRVFPPGRVQMQVRLEAPAGQELMLGISEEMPARLGFFLLRDGKKIVEGWDEDLRWVQYPLRDSLTVQATLHLAYPPGEYELALFLYSGWLAATAHGPRIPIRIE